MSGMNDYTADYIDVVENFWTANEKAEGYTPSIYAESTDAGGNVRLSAKTKYNEYNSFGMKWAYNSSTEIGDLNVLYKPRIKKYVLVEATKEDVGFIELKIGTFKQLREEMEYYETEKQRKIRSDGSEETVDQVLRDSWFGQNNIDGDNVDAGNRRTGIQNAELSKGKSKSNKAADTKKDNGNLSDEVKDKIKAETIDSNVDDAIEKYNKAVEDYEEKAYSINKYSLVKVEVLAPLETSLGERWIVFSNIHLSNSRSFPDIDVPNEFDAEFEAYYNQLTERQLNIVPKPKKHLNITGKMEFYYPCSDIFLAMQGKRAGEIAELWIGVRYKIITVINLDVE